MDAALWENAGGIFKEKKTFIYVCFVETKKAL